MTKKLTLSGCLTKLIIVILVLMAFVWLFSYLFPRAYRVIENKAFNITDSDYVLTTVNDTNVIPIADIDKPTAMRQVDAPPLIVKLETKGNTHYIPVKVNGIPMTFILDTGATTMSMSLIEYKFMERQGLIADKLQTASCTTATGDEKECYIAKLNSVTIGSCDVGINTVNDVDCIIVNNQDAPLLLGQNVLNKLGKVSIDYRKNQFIFEK